MFKEGFKLPEGFKLTRRSLVILLVVVFAFLLLILRSCGSEQVKKIVSAKGDVIKTKKEDISVREFENRFLKENPQVELLRGDESYILPLKKDFAFKLADDLILRALAEESNIKVSDDEVLAEINKMKEGYTEDTFKETLKQEKVTIKEITESIMDRLTIKKVLDEKVYKGITISDDEIAEFYNQFKNVFYKPEEFKISEISVKDEAKAKEILESLKTKKIEFENAAKENAHPTEEELNKDAYLQESGLPEEFVNAIRGLAPGSLTGIIKNSEGYHILKLEDKINGHIPKIEEVKSNIERMIREKKEKIAYSKFMEKYRKEMGVVISDEYFKIGKNKK